MQRKIRRITQIIMPLIFTLIISSCSGYQYDGDIIAAMESGSTSTISFKKDKSSEVAFQLTYEIGKDYNVTDLPGNDNEAVDKLNPGFELGGWLPDTSDSDFMSGVQYDENGFIKSFHMTPMNLIFYGAGYFASTDTPYKIIYKIQNETLDGYDYYDEVIMTGTTSTPEAPSYTDAASNLIEIEGFKARTDLIVEQEILADGSTVVEVFYDRLPEVSISITIPATNEITITSTTTGTTINFTVVLPDVASESDYSYCWFYTNEGMGNPLSTASTLSLDASTLTNGIYQISLIAVRNSDSMPFGGTVQIRVGV